MIIINICDLNIQINNKYDFIEKLCIDYLAKNNSKVDFIVEASEEEILEEKSLTDFEYPIGGYESTVILRKISLKMLEYKGILIHSSVVSLNNEAYAFMAPSGTGKSTHTRLWLEYFKNQDIKVVNGDKPIYRLQEDGLYVYGSPWAGKEGYNSNCKVKVKALCFLERGEKNSIVKLSSKEVIKRIFSQILLPKDNELMDKTFEILNEIIKIIPFYLLKCNISYEAVEISFKEMKGMK